MCKNATTPCPGCKEHEETDAVWMFFTDDERKDIETSRKRPAMLELSFLKPEAAHIGLRPAASNG